MTLSQVLLGVDPVSLQTHRVVIFPVLESMIGVDTLSSWRSLCTSSLTSRWEQPRENHEHCLHLAKQ